MKNFYAIVLENDGVHKENGPMVMETFLMESGKDIELHNYIRTRDNIIAMNKHGKAYVARLVFDIPGQEVPEFAKGSDDCQPKPTQNMYTEALLRHILNNMVRSFSVLLKTVRDELDTALASAAIEAIDQPENSVKIAYAQKLKYAADDRAKIYSFLLKELGSIFSIANIRKE